MTTDAATQLLADRLNLGMGENELTPAEKPGTKVGQPVEGVGGGSESFVVSSESGPGYYTMWWVEDENNTQYGVTSLCSANMVNAKRQERNVETGRLRWTFKDPGITPFQGIAKCWLHEDGKARELASDYGFVICPKSDLPNEFEAERHMQKKHPVEYAAIQERVARLERDEDRQIQKAIFESLKPGEELKGEVANISGIPDTPPVEMPPQPEGHDTAALGCWICKWKSEALRRADRRKGVARHVSEEHSA